MIMTSHVIRIQRKFKEQRIYREAKIDMLKLYWTQVLGQFVDITCEKCDAKLKDVAAYMMQIEEGIQDYILRRLIFQIQKLVSIATYRNRQLSRPNDCDHDEIELQIEKFQTLLLTDVEEIRDPQITIKEETRIKS